VFPVTPHLQFTGEYSYSVPALSLPYNSILWVFADTTHQYAGVSARVGLEQFHLHVPLDFELAYRRIFEEFTNFGDSNTAGNRYIGRATWRPAKATSVGVEVSRLWQPPTTLQGGFWQARAFASGKAYGFTGTLDFQGYWYDQPVNATMQSIIGSATLGYEIGDGFSVVGALSGGSTPYFSSYVNGLVKLTYNATYRSREVY
jgi:hypothetical protein